MPEPHILVVAAKLPEFEGSIPWMYLDTVGKVTVAEGLMLPDVPSAVALPFQFSGATAEPGDIRADYLRVEKMTPGKVPGYYHCDTSVTLSRDAMQKLTLDQLSEADRYCRIQFPEFATYPQGAKAAILDMMYNMGPGRFKNFHKLIAAVGERDWNEAGNQCHRMGINDQRNAWTANQFLEVDYAGT